MIARISTVAFQGIDALPVDVQVMVAPGKVGMQIVGLPDKAVAESRERVQAALHASGLTLPAKKVTINLAPADLPKEGSHFDLAIALGLMVAIGAIPADAVENYCAIGELGLDGTLAAIAGALPAAIGAHSTGKGIICPEPCGPEAAWAGDDVDVLAPRSLIALANHFAGTQVLTRPRPALRPAPMADLDMADVRGQESAKRALEIAAAGGHNLLMVGPPGSGKSMLAARLPSILPDLAPQELLETSMIASVAGLLNGGKLSARRPFRAPHHSASMAAMVGGGLRVKPGEVSLAHRGVLFLDELPEFTPQVLDSLRQPLELGTTMIARANSRVTYPSRVQLIAAMNPCRCGHAGEAGHTCVRGARCASDYQARISGPLLDRIDLRIEVPAVNPSDLIGIKAEQKKGETSAIIAARVAHVRNIQKQRYDDLRKSGQLKDPSVSTNADCPAALVEQVAQADEAAIDLLGKAADRMGLSARAFHRILKVARTLADLEEQQGVGRMHIAEALSMRINIKIGAALAA